MESHLKQREWRVRENSTGDMSALLSELALSTGLSEITLRVCLSRGLGTAEAIQDFLSPRLDALTRPSLITDLPKAVARISRAREAGEKLRIYGDYDVDGTTGAALLSWGFRELGLEFEARQPDRFKDGYGLNVGAVEEAVASSARVLVTVDCGITSFDAAARAAELGIDLIIIDHHQIDTVKGLPTAHAIVNPQRADDTSGLKQLCGCGLAFYLLMALRSHGREQNWFKPGEEPNLKQHLDLVVMATAADMVPLTGDNHILVKQGLEVLKNSKKPGVRALLEAAGVADREISPGHLGFVIGPRINASGRMGSASLALELLTTTDATRARDLAYQLEKINAERAETQNHIWDEVRIRVEQGLAQGKFKHGVVVADPGWHEGVVGIVASRVTETFRKPAAVIALREDFGKGSVRSYGGKDVLQALRDSASTLLGFGGHKHAAGLTVGLDVVEAFAEAFDKALGVLTEEVEFTPLMTEGSCDIRDLNVRTLTELERLGPFGPGNPEPVFTFKASVKSHRVLKGRHLKLDLGAVEAIWFGAAEREELLRAATGPRESEWAGVPELNRFRGNVTPTIRVRDWRAISSAEI